ncbi:hypothetical protein D3C81_1540620 [compost metagenome]
MAAVLNEDTEQLLLCFAQFNRIAIFRKLHFTERKPKAVNLYGLASRGICASQPGINSCPQNHQAERLGDIIIRSQFQAGDYIRFHIVSGQDDDGDGGGTAQFLEYIKPVSIGQIEIQNDQIEAVTLYILSGFVQIFGLNKGKLTVLECKNYTLA